MKITAENLDSSMLEKISYERDLMLSTGELSVLFKNGATYYYSNVLWEDVSKIIFTEMSVGSLFITNIKNKYDWFDKTIYKETTNNQETGEK